MKHRNYFILLFNFSITITPLHLSSQENSLETTSPKSSQSGIFTEEDFSPILVPGKLAKDQNYTMGFGIHWTGKDNKNVLNNIRKRTTRMIANLIGIDAFDKESVEKVGEFDRTNPMISLSGAAFTPDSLQKKEISQNDRPYSFLLALSSAQTYVDVEIPWKAYTYRMTLGAYGTRIGKFVQSAIHRSMNDGNTKDPFNPEGWEHQIGDGLEPAILYEYRVDKLVNKNRMTSQKHRSYFELCLAKEILIGYYTGVAMEVFGRVGVLDPKNWISKFNHLSNVNKNRQAPKLSRKRGEFFLYYSVKPNIIIFNQGLSGGLWGTAYRLKPLVEANPFIIEASIGIGATLKVNRARTKFFNIGWTPIAVRTPEMWNSKIQRFHYWGGIYLNFIH